MAKRIGTSRTKTRHKFQKKKKDRGKISLRRYLQVLKEGDRVTLLAEPAVHKGLYFPRFHGKVGTVHRRVGTCYEVFVKDFNKEKLLIVHPVHLRRITQ